MKTFRVYISLSLLLLGLNTAHAEDIDIFLTPPSTAVRPNVLIIVDNTANWSSSFTSEMQALASVVGGLTDKVNVGIMMFTETGAGNSTPDGGYVRSAIRQMTPANKNTLVTLVNSFGVNADKSNGSKFSLAMMEAFQYFKGLEAYAGFNKAKKDSAAFVGASSTYATPLNDACQKNFIIFLSNGPAGDNTSDGTTAKTKLAEYAGLASNTFPPEISLSPNQEQSVWADEWSRFIANTDVSAIAGVQNIITYTVDVVNTNNETQSWQAHSALLNSMSKQGKGKYFKISNAGQNATTTTAISNALNAILNEVQAVDSVFAASTLPVSVNVRGTYLNQVYMGVFRPDAEASPRWYGNLKQYKLALDSAGDLFLADVNSVAIENSATGFINPNVTSVWTTSSSNYWSFKYPDVPDDAPDGDKVEKGGAAQKIRTAYPASQATRKLYTCTGACTNGAIFGPANDTVFDTLFSTANTTNITQALLGAASTTERDNIINWVRGADNIDDENGNGSLTDIRSSVHGDVLHSRPAVINYNRSGQPADRDIYVFYGGNDGVFHAAKGGNNSADGSEAWGFIPSELFGQFKRLRNATTDTTNTKITTTNTKPYFMDGPIGIYYLDSNADGRFTANDGDKVHIFIGSRRGGRFIYALDVSDPVAPKFLWKKTSTSADYGELGFTWSEPKVARINYGGTAKNVLIFGAGYDPTVDDLDPDRTYTTVSSSVSGSTTTTVSTATRKQLTTDNSSSDGTVISTSTVTVTTAVTTGGTTTTTIGSPTTTATTFNRTMGRGLYVVDAADGTVLWRAGRTSSGANLIVSGMDYSIPSDITSLDLDNNGYIESLYFGDTGGNLWRANIGDQSTSNWTVTKLASIGGSAANKRKFLFKPDVVVTTSYRAILIGSGDREHPLDTTVTNRFYMVKDTGTSSGFTESNLIDVTEDSVQSSVSATSTAAAASIESSNGWYITLETGEKVIGGAITLGGASYFATNQPSATLAAGSCSNLGLARFYGVAFNDGGALGDSNVDGTLTKADRVTASSIGLPPSPIGISVDIGGNTYETVCQGTHCQKPPSVTVGQRYRVYWHLDIDK